MGALYHVCNAQMRIMLTSRPMSNERKVSWMGLAETRRNSQRKCRGAPAGHRQDKSDSIPSSKHFFSVMMMLEIHALSVIQTLQTRLAPDVYAECYSILELVRAHRCDEALNQCCKTRLVSAVQQSQDEVAIRELTAYLDRHDAQAAAKDCGSDLMAYLTEYPLCGRLDHCASRDEDIDRVSEHRG